VGTDTNQWDVAYEALKDITFQGNERVLDLGCGSGKITANIAGRVPSGSVKGIDLSQGMIDFAQNTYTPYHDNLIFIKENILELNASSEFDLIFSSSSLHWILDHEPLLAYVHKALKPGGSILFTIPCTPLKEVATTIQDVTSQEPWNIYFKDYNHPRRKFIVEEYHQLLKHAGFDEIAVVQVPFTYYFETRREFADWFAAFSPMLLYIPKAKHEDFLTSIVERYLKTFPLGKDGQITFKQNELIIKAVKR